MRRRLASEGFATRGAHAIKVQEARRQRREMTPAERALWALVRRDGLGVPCRRIHVIEGWLVDFYIPAARLVIEVDGAVHDTQQTEDEDRTAALQALGLEVLRVRNEQVLDAPERVLAWLKGRVDARVLR